MPEKIAAAEMLSSELKGKKRDGSCRTRTDSDSSYIVEEWLQKEDKSSEKKNASCLNKVGSALQARRPGKNPPLAYYYTTLDPKKFQTL